MSELNNKCMYGSTSTKLILSELIPTKSELKINCFMFGYKSELKINCFMFGYKSELNNNI